MDITKRIEQEGNLQEALQALTRSNRELENFAYVASHDLQAPLRHISSYVDLISDTVIQNASPEVKKWFKYILDGTATMKALIDGLLAYSRVRGDKREFINVDLNAIVEKVSMYLKSLDSSAKIEWMHLPNVKGSEMHLQQLFQNLLQNAVKYRRKDVSPVIKISCEEHTDYYQVSVSDNGIGIDPTHFEKIFQLFQRLHTREQYEGTGLGLALCRKIVELHGGKIWLESAPGQGATFFITLNKGVKELRSAEDPLKNVA